METTEQKIAKVISEHLNIEIAKVTSTANLIDDLNADSLDVVEVVMALEEEFTIDIKDDETEKLSQPEFKIADIVAMIDGKLASAAATA